MIICACLLVNTIQVNKLYQVVFCFMIDTVNDEMTVFSVMTIKTTMIVQLLD